MAGGTFDKLVGKVRPGTYVNKESTKQDVIALAERGTILIPMEMDWGPVHEFITMTNTAPDGQYEKLGYSIYDSDAKNSMLKIREAFKLAQKVIIYRLNSGTKAASAAVGSLTAAAAYPGTHGNALKIVITANPVSGFDVTVYLNTSVVFSQEGAATIGNLETCAWVEWSGTSTAALVATAGTSLTGGEDADKTNLDVTGFLDASENEVWNAMAFPFSDTTLQAALKTKIKYFRENVGKMVTAAVPSYAANYDGIDSVDNAPILSDGTTMTKEQATVWIAAAAASASNTTSNTYLVYDGAVGISGKKTHEEAVAAIKAGHMFFSVVDGEIVLEYDVNTLTDFTYPKSKDYRKNRVRRVLDTLDESIQLNFPPNAFDNADESADSTRPGWGCMESKGRQILTEFQKASAIHDVDLDNDFVIDREASSGDETYITVGAAPTDSSEKLYFTVRTR